MKICHVITRLIIGGAQENTVLSCEGLHRRGHQVLLLAGPETGPEGSLWDRARRGGYQVEVVAPLQRAVQPGRDLQALGAVHRALKQFGADVVHTHSSKAGIVGRLAAVLLPQVTVVHTIHGMSFNRTQPGWLRASFRVLEWLAAQRSDRLVGVAEAMTRQAAEAGIAPREQFTTIYSGMQCAWFRPDSQRRRAVRQRWGVSEREVVVGTVARLFRNKGYEQLIPAMAAVCAARRDLRWVWVGDGADRQRYLEAVERLGLRDRVTLCGLVPPDEVAAHMQGFDILAHCSQWEGLPRSVVQALLLEIPAVTFDIDGAPEVVVDRVTGRLVPLNDTDALAAAINQLARDPDERRRLGQAGRAKCLEMFDHDRMVDALQKLYLELVAKKDSPATARAASP